MRLRRLFVLAALAAACATVLTPTAVAVAPPGVHAERATAVPLAAPSPGWYTGELHRRVLAAGAAGVPVPAEAPLPKTSLAFTGIRPGSWIVSPNLCTAGFLLADANNNNNRYLTTAGHCTAVGEDVIVLVLAAPDELVLVHAGETVARQNNGVGDDFALVKLRAELRDQVSPSMAHVGGPSGAMVPARGDAVVHTGHGLGAGAGGTPRAGVVTWLKGTETNAFGWAGAATPGDSGSPVRRVDGPAAGILTHIAYGVGYYEASTLLGTTIHRIVSATGKRLLCAPPVPAPLVGTGDQQACGS